jgi:hypothetical protein
MEDVSAPVGIKVEPLEPGSSCQWLSIFMQICFVETSLKSKRNSKKRNKNDGNAIDKHNIIIVDTSYAMTSNTLKLRCKKGFILIEIDDMGEL